MEEDEESISDGENIQKKQVNAPKVGQEQIQGLLFGDKLSWQAIIYDLINTEQLDPWDINISLLSDKYLDKVRLLEEANFFVSSKVLLAAALLLRLKSEILLNKYLPSLDDILFGRKEEPKEYTQERLELDEDLPDLVPRTPLPRFRKVTLAELMASLGKAIATETRRIKRVVVEKQREMEVNVSLPKKIINLKDKINEVYEKLMGIFSSREEKISFSELAGHEKEERIYTFVPLLHLDYQHRIVLEQEKHFEEIWIWIKKLHEKVFKEELEKMRKEVEEALEKETPKLSEEELQRAEEIEEGGEFEHPLGDLEKQEKVMEDDEEE
jgi:segregation and condensation protein A